MWIRVLARHGVCTKSPLANQLFIPLSGEIPAVEATLFFGAGRSICSEVETNWSRLSAKNATSTQLPNKCLRHCA